MSLNKMIEKIAALQNPTVQGWIPSWIISRPISRRKPMRRTARR